MSIFSQRISEATFCVTKRGYVGLVPRKAKAGDSICILHGTKAPFVLRAKAEKGSLHTMIGECYVHGIMNGEGTKFEDVIAQDFELV